MSSRNLATVNVILSYLCGMGHMSTKLDSYKLCHERSNIWWKGVQLKIENSWKLEGYNHFWKRK